ncbi:hypothetical protein Agub_g11200, partial [Astrephomene gubernaculifera]
ALLDWAVGRLLEGEERGSSGSGSGSESGDDEGDASESGSGSKTGSEERPIEAVLAEVEAAVAVVEAAANCGGSSGGGGGDEVVRAAAARVLPPPVAVPLSCGVLRMCGNPRCGNYSGEAEGDLKRLRVLRRCGGCRAVHYCSVECQKQHWEEGGHKPDCMASRRLELQGAACC